MGSSPSWHRTLLVASRPEVRRSLFLNLRYLVRVAAEPLDVLFQTVRSFTQASFTDGREQSRRVGGTVFDVCFGVYSGSVAFRSVITGSMETESSRRAED